MKTWVRTLTGVSCGACSRWLEQGQIVRQIGMPGMRRPLYRCPSCAGETAPDLPAFIPKQTPIQPSLWTGSRQLAEDWKVKQGGRDE